MSGIDLSLIVPCFNEELILKNSMEQIIEVLDNTRFSYEIIFIDDCSKDETRGIIEGIIDSYPDKRITRIFHEKNAGRGDTVAEGLNIAKGKIAGFIDIDLSTSARYIPALVMEIKKGADIATALRVYKLSRATMHRWILSKGYKFLVKILLKLELQDTETGCKFFNREKIIPILEDVLDNHWFWDTEIMARSYIKGLKIREVPSVFIRKGLYTRVRIIRDSFWHLLNLIKFRQELKKKGLLKK